MESVKLSNTNLDITRLGFGCGPLGGTDWGQFDEDESMAAVLKAIDLGVTFFDTADIYGLGCSERLLSKALGQRRHDVIIATKFGVNWENSPNGNRAKTFYDSSPERVVEALENSLRRLRIDTIPLYFIHWPDPDTPLSDTIEALARCQESGKIQHIGVSNFSPDQIRETSERISLAAVQMQYSLIDRRVEKELIPCCQELGISVITYGPLAQGLLTGKYEMDAQFGLDDCRSRLAHFKGEDFERKLEIVNRLREMEKCYNKLSTQIAIRWVLDNPAISCVISGIKSPAQIEQNAGAVGWNLTSEDYEYLVNG